MQAGGREAVTDFREILLQGHPEMLLAPSEIVQRSGRPNGGRLGRAKQAAGPVGDLTAGTTEGGNRRKEKMKKRRKESTGECRPVNEIKRLIKC